MLGWSATQSRQANTPDTSLLALSPPRCLLHLCVPTVAKHEGVHRAHWVCASAENVAQNILSMFPVLQQLVSACPQKRPHTSEGKHMLLMMPSSSPLRYRMLPGAGGEGAAKYRQQVPTPGSALDGASCTGHACRQRGTFWKGKVTNGHLWPWKPYGDGSLCLHKTSSCFKFYVDRQILCTNRQA